MASQGSAGGTTPSTVPPVLQVDKISKSFGGLRALSDVSLTLAAGTTTGIIGPNGAGKSTLVNVISGLYAQDQGRILLDGHDISRTTMHRRARAGLLRTFQHPHLFGGMSVEKMLQTVLMAPRRRQGTERPSPSEALAAFGLAHLSRRPVDELPYGLKKLMNVIATWALGPKVLLLDEPFAGIGDREAELFGQSLEVMRAGGLALGLIEHNVDVVMAVSQSLVVLDSGQVIFEGSPAAGRRDPRVVEAYFGIGQTVEAVGS